MNIADIQSETRDLCDADTTSYPAAALLRRTNTALEKVIAWMINADGTWQYDDTNYTDLPVGTGTLVSGQSSYSFASEYLDILEVMILTTGGKYVRITSFDPDEVGMSFDEWTNSTNGTPPNGFPAYYDKVGDSIRLSNSPTATYVTLAAGLKVRFKRTADLFTSAQVTTGTKEPGFASPFHIILCYMSAEPYCAKYKKDLVPWLVAKIGDTPQPTGMKKEILKHYALREKDKRHIMSHKKILYI